MKFKSVMEDLIEEQIKLTGELEEMTFHLAKRDVEIATLKVAYLKAQKEGLVGNKYLLAENEMQRAKVQALEAMVENLTQQLLKNHMIENERMTLLLRQLSGLSFGPPT